MTDMYNKKISYKNILKTQSKCCVIGHVPEEKKLSGLNKWLSLWHFEKQSN